MCTSLADQISYCQSATPGFSTLPNTAQASCFCFDKDGSYNGTIWDMAASTCYQAMQSESQPASVLSNYKSVVVGACTKYVDAGVLSSADVTGAAASTAGSASKAALAAKTTAGTKASTGSSSSAKPTASSTTATAKSGAVGVGEKNLVAGILAGVGIVVGVLL